jgi:hypothetical protein
MAYDFSNTLTTLNSPNSNNENRNLKLAVRVVDVILGNSHPEWEKFGKEQGIGAIKFVPLGLDVDTTDPSTLPVAFPENTGMRLYPLKNEIVFINSSPDYSTANDKETNRVVKYTSPLSIWNTVHHNASPKRGTEKVDLGFDVEEQATINPMQPYPGDLLIEGRHGQSIRFNGTNHDLNPLVDESNKNSPLTIISNGQKETESGIEFISEDINKDASSIYLTSNHAVPLISAQDKREAFNEIPVSSDSYKGKQVVINSGRLYFNSKEEDIHLNSVNNIGLTSKVLGMDAINYIGLDAEKIYLGKRARQREQHPVIKGDSLEVWLKALTDQLNRVAIAMQSAANGAGPIVSLVKEAPILIKALKLLEKDINPGGESTLKSKKVYTE